MRGKALGAEHTSTETSLNNLALLYEKQGLYSKAEPFALRSLSIRDKELSTEHPDVRNGLNILATLYQAQQLYNKAMPL
ncbi:MAG: tetratricopeptide repeat protein [Prochlorococcus sp.]